MEKTYTFKIVACIARKTNKQPMTHNAKIKGIDVVDAMQKARKTYPYGAYNLYVIGEK